MKLFTALKNFFCRGANAPLVTTKFYKEDFKYTDYLSVETRETGSFIVWPDGSVYGGPYKRSADAKGRLTRLIKAEK